MKKYAHLYEITKPMKLQLEEDLGQHITALSYNEKDIKKALLDLLGLKLELKDVMVGIKVETNGGRTILILSEKPFSNAVEVQYRYREGPGKTLADWLFYLEDLCIAFNIPRRTFFEGEQ